MSAGGASGGKRSRSASGRSPRDTEEIAAIADNMFVPNEIQVWIDRRRGTVDLPESQALIKNKE